MIFLHSLHALIFLNTAYDMPGLAEKERVERGRLRASEFSILDKPATKCRRRPDEPLAGTKKKQRREPSALCIIRSPQHQSHTGL